MNEWNELTIFIFYQSNWEIEYLNRIFGTYNNKDGRTSFENGDKFLPKICRLLLIHFTQIL